MAPTRLTKRSKPVRLLRAKFEDGEISGKEDPKVVWQSNDVFSGCNLNNFRTCYNTMGKEFLSKSKSFITFLKLQAFSDIICFILLS